MHPFSGPSGLQVPILFPSMKISAYSELESMSVRIISTSKAYNVFGSTLISAMISICVLRQLVHPKISITSYSVYKEKYDNNNNNNNDNNMSIDTFIVDSLFINYQSMTVAKISLHLGSF